MDESCINIYTKMSVSKKDAIINIRATGLVPVYFHHDVDMLLRSVSVSYDCGIRAFEFMHQRDNKGLRYFEYLVERLDKFPGLMLGVGTVLDATMTERYIHSGASFIASPFMRPDMGEVCQRHDILWMPGCSAVPEIERAKALGAQVINVSPGNVLGPEFVATVARQFTDLQFIPSGIADLRDAELMKWFESGAMAVKLNALLFTKDLIAEKNWKAIEHNLIALLKSIRKIQATVKPLNILK